MSVLANLIVKLSADTTALERGLKGAKGHASKFDTVMKGAMIGGATAVAGLGAASLKMGMDFEKTMAEVKTLIPDISEKAFGKMRDDVLDLSKEMGIATTKAVPALYQAISAGIPRGNVMEFMEVASKAAIGGVTGLETAVDGLSTVVNAFGYEASEAGRVADILFTGVRLGKTSMEELSTSMFQAAPLAAALGLEIEDIVAATATLTKTGTPTSVAMSQIRQAMVSLSKPNKEMIDLLGRTGSASGEALLQSEGFAGALDILTTAAGGNKEMMAKAFGSVEALQAVLGLTGENAEIAAADLAAMADSAGAADEAFKTISETTSYKLNKAINEMKVEMTRVAVRVLPLLVAGLEKIRPIIIPLVGAIGALIAAWVAWKIVGLVSQIGTLVTALRSMNLALIGPVGIVAALGIGAFALGKFIEKNRDAIDAIPVLGGLISGSARYQRELNEAIKEATDLYERNLISAEQLKVQGIDALGDALVTLHDEYKESMVKAGAWEAVVAGATQGVSSAAAELVKDMQREGVSYERILDALERAEIDWKDTTIEDVLEPMRIKYYTSMVENDTALRMLATAHKRAKDNIVEDTTALETVVTLSFDEIKDSIKSVLPTVDQTFAEWSKQLVEMYSAQVNFDSNLRRLYEEMSAAGVENVGDIVRVYEEGGPLMTQAGVDMVLETTGGMEAARLQGAHITAAKAYTGDIVGTIEEEKTTMVLEMFAFARAMVTGFATKLAEETPRAKAAVATMTGELKRALTESPEYKTWHWGVGMAEALAGGLMHGLKAESPALAIYLRQWGYTVAEDLTIVPLAFYETGTTGVQRFIEGMNGEVGDLHEALRRVGAVITEDLSIVPLSFYGIAGQSIEYFQHALKSKESSVSRVLAEFGLGIAEDLSIVPLSFWDTGIESAKGLVGGVKNLEAATGREVANSLRRAMHSFSGEAGDWGRSIGGYTMAGIWHAFNEDWADWAEDIADIIYNELKDALGAASPATKMIPLGVMAAQGYAQGFQKALAGRSLTMPALAAPVGAYAPVGAAAGVSGGGTTVIHHHIEPHFDGPLLGDQRQAEEFARLIMPIIRRDLG